MHPIDMSFNNPKDSLEEDDFRDEFEEEFKDTVEALEVVDEED
jgi:hypothetical protein